MKNSEYLSKVESNMAPNRLFCLVLAATLPSSTSNTPQMTIETPAQKGCFKKKKTPAPIPENRAKKLKVFGLILRLTIKEATLFRVLSENIINFFGSMRTASYVWLFISNLLDHRI